MKIGSTAITAIKIGSTTINKVIKNGITYFETASFSPSDLTGLSLWTKSRSGLEMVDSLAGTNPTIITPFLYKAAIGYAEVADNGALNVGATDFTLNVKAKSIGTTKATRYLAGKLIDNNPNGAYGIYASATTGYIAAYIRLGGATKSVISTTNFFTREWFNIRMEVDYTALKIRLFINNTQVGTGTAFTGEMPDMGDEYLFRIGAGANSSNVAPSAGIDAIFSDVVVYHRLLTAAEKANTLNDIYPTDTAAHYDCVVRTDNVLLDLSGNDLHMTGVNLVKATVKKYSVNGVGGGGSRQSLEKGYTLYEAPYLKEIQIPHDDTGTPLTGISTPAGYTKIGDYDGVANAHNMADSYIYLNDANYKRDDITKATYLGRSTVLKNYYNSDRLYDWHVTELYNKGISNCLKNSVKGTLFTKIDSSRVFSDLLIYGDNKTVTDYDNLIKWSTETNCYRFIYSFVDYYPAMRGTKVLKYTYEAPGVGWLHLSTDNGATFPTSLNIGNISALEHAHFFENGNILFCSTQKAFLSTDNLGTYNEIAITGADGDPFVPSDKQNFRDISYDFASTVDGEIHVFGAYVSDGSGYEDNVNVWYSADNGATLKSAYLFGYTDVGLEVDHIHAVNYNTAENAFYLQTGDGGLGSVSCHWLKGEYDFETDAWTWATIVSHDNTSFSKTTGMIFTDTDAYFASDNTSSATYLGVYKTPLSDMTNTALMERVLFNDTNETDNIYGSIDGGNGDNLPGILVILTGADKRIAFTTDLITFYSQELDGGNALGGLGYMFCRGKLDNGTFVLDQFESDEGTDYKKGECVLVKAVKIS